MQSAAAPTGQDDAAPDAPPRVDPANPAAVWSALLDSVHQSNAAAWLDLFTLHRLDTAARPTRATIAPASNTAHARRFATPPRLERLGQRLAELLGQPVRVTVADAATPNPLRDADQPHHTGGAAATSTATGGGGEVDRRAALDLPLVRDALEVFPDAVLIDARQETPDPPDDPDQREP